ncbi:hypothetical protein VPH35_038280 [Triticum aestivum]
MPPRYDGAADPSALLLAYEEAVLKAGGDDMVMANWLPMALTGAPRAWLLALPGSSVASWEELCGLFTARFAALAPPAVATLLGGSQAPPSGRHTRPFFRQIGAAFMRQGAPPGWAAPKADLTFDSGDHAVATVSSGVLPMLCTPTICNMAVTKTLIDGGAGLNVLSVETFSLPLRTTRAAPPQQAFLWGRRRLRPPPRADSPSRDLRHTRQLPHRAGRLRHRSHRPPVPGSKDVLTIVGDTKEALAALNLALKAAAAARPTSEATPGVKEAALAERKQLFTQDRAETKQVPVEEDGSSGATFTIGANLDPGQEEALVKFLHANKEVFAWEPKQLVGVPRGVIEHHLRVCPNVRPVKQKARRQSTEKQAFIVQETRKLEAAGVICEIVDSTAECDLLCFLDAFSGCHQIKMAVEDMEKTAFLTPCGVYCYTCMPFGLRNAGATFQRLIHIALGQQLGRNAEAYVDDIVVKSREERTLIQDLEETFASLRNMDLRLNLEKCVFGVPSDKLLGFLVSHRGIEANPEKVKAIDDMSPSQTLKEMQKLAGCVTSLGYFISKLGERALPFFKLMKKKGSFEWTPEAVQAFQDLKRHLTSPPVMVAPRPLEPLVLYLAATPYSASVALVAVQEERQAKDASCQATPPAGVIQDPEGTAKVAATPTKYQA